MKSEWKEVFDLISINIYIIYKIYQKKYVLMFINFCLITELSSLLSGINNIKYLY